MLVLGRTLRLAVRRTVKSGAPGPSSGFLRANCYVVRGRVRHSLVVSPERVGRLGLSLYVMSDCYLGLDQQFALPLLVEEAGEEIFYSDEE